MTDEQIAELILHRLYHGAFEMGVEYAPNLHEFAKEIGVENNRIWEAYYRLNDQYLVEAFAIGGSVNITSSGIHYCETNGIAEDDLAAHQQQTRTRLLDAAMRLREKHGHNALIDWTHLCSEADVEEQDFHNNYHFLVDFGMLESATLRSFQITPAGMKAVEDYRQRVARLKAFEGLLSLDGTTPQQRGHQLEDLLTEVAISEDWDAKQRVRSQGQEHDIIMHVGLHYFLVSCKWEKDRIEPKEVELLESRVRSRATTNVGLLFSMSGFTVNCIEEARLKISSAHILLFGPKDIQNVFCGKSSLTDLLDAKLEQAMHHRRVLVDGEAH